MSSVNDFRDAAVEVFHAGRRIFFEGEPGETMFVVKKGEVELSFAGVTVATLSRGGIFGEMALIDDKPRSATAVAKTDCELVPIDRDRFVSLVRENPQFALDVMKVLAERIRLMNERL